MDDGSAHCRGRKQRELDPAAAALRECLMEARGDAAVSPQLRQRLEEMLNFVERAGGWYEQMLTLPKNQVLALMKLGSGVVRVLDRGRERPARRHQTTKGATFMSACSPLPTCHCRLAADENPGFAPCSIQPTGNELPAPGATPVLLQARARADLVYVGEVAETRMTFAGRCFGRLGRLIGAPLPLAPGRSDGGGSDGDRRRDAGRTTLDAHLRAAGEVSRR